MAYVMVAVAGFNVMQSIQAGSYAKAQAGLQAQQMEYQGKIERETALQTARIIRRAGRRTVAEANAAYVGAGVVIGEGSAGVVEGQITNDYEHDAYQAILEGGRRARGMETDAKLTRIDGSMKQTAGYVNAVGSALSAYAMGSRASGWRTGGPGFSGTQAPAPVTDMSTYGPGTARGIY